MGTYEPVPQLSREIAESQLASADQRGRIDAILSLALHDPDWRWVQDRCLDLLHDSDRDIVATAILGLAHLARLHRQMDVARVLRELQPLSADSVLAGRVSDALDDIEVFVVDHGIDRDVRVWLDPDGGITMKAVTPEGDPVELSSTQARRLARALDELADQDDR